jgi:hypothetical protein
MFSKQGSDADMLRGLETKVVLIDGVQVAELMFELPTGVFIY